MTPKLKSIAASKIYSSGRCRSEEKCEPPAWAGAVGALVRPKVSPTEATRPSVRQAGCFAIRTRRSASNQYVDTGDWGLLPFVAAHVSAPETNWQSAQQVWESELIAYRGRHEARSMAKTAVSGSLIGSMPTRLIMETTVPSGSASTHAARCSKPR